MSLLNGGSNHKISITKTVSPQLMCYLTYVNSTLHEFLLAIADLKKLRKCILHPVGNEWQTRLGRKNYIGCVIP